MTQKSIALLFTPVGLILIGAARLFIISDYNTTTAITIASSGGYVSTLLGSVIPLVPVFMPYMALVLLLFRRFLLSIIAFVFAAFITPTPLTLPAALSIMKADEHHFSSRSSSYVPIVVIMTLIILFILASQTANLFETLSGGVVVLTAFAVLYATSNARPSAPVSLRLASNGEHRVIALASSHLPIAILIAAIPFILVLVYQTPAAAIASSIAILATVALFPYIYNIFPVPHHQNYYAEVLHELWLPPEGITMHSGNIYYGYVLSADPDWVIVLLVNSRTIVYLRAEDVEGRAVCQAAQKDQPYPYPPLVKIFYTPPPQIPSCSPKITAFRSNGESLSVISSDEGMSPRQVISLTNSYQRQLLSARLRAYERSGDWNAPTPVGQHFWYYPRSTS